MIWKVEMDFCAEGTTHYRNKPCEYDYYPKIKITTSEGLTRAQKTKINNEIVKAASAAVGYGIGEEVEK